MEDEIDRSIRTVNGFGLGGGGKLVCGYAARDPEEGRITGADVLQLAQAHALFGGSHPALEITRGRGQSGYPAQ